MAVSLRLCTKYCGVRPLPFQRSMTYARGGVTFIDSVVTTATAVSQWSTVKAAQKGVVNGQSMLRNTVNDDNGRLQCRMDELIHKNHNLHLSLRAFRSTRIEQQALHEVSRTINSQNCRTVKVQQPKDRWSTVKPLRSARQNFNPQLQLSMEVAPLDICIVMQ